MTRTDPTPARPDVSFVVPCFRSRQTVGRTLESIFAQRTDLRFEVIVVESSGDSTAEWIQRVFPRVQVIGSDTQKLPGAARNLGAGLARGRWLAFLDADTGAASDWLATLHDRTSHNDSIVMIGAAVKNANPESISSRVLHWIEFSEFIKGLPSGFRSHLSSSNLLVRREDFLAVGGFDERLAMAEDLLLSRIFPEGLYFESATTIGHISRSTWPQITEHLRSLGFWSGCLRRGVKTRGSRLKSFPPASFLLPLFRAVRVVGRVWRAGRSEGLQAFLHFPLILLALFSWAAGFYQGLRQGPPPP